MILILIGFVALLVLLVWVAQASDHGSPLEFVCFLGMVCWFIIFVTGLCLGLGYVEAGYKAEVINREYGTSYTQREVFFASDVIDTIRQMDRQRIEINGDLLKAK